jgi:hypothetical protein
MATTQKGKPGKSSYGAPVRDAGVRLTRPRPSELAAQQEERMLRLAAVAGPLTPIKSAAAGDIAAQATQRVPTAAAIARLKAAWLRHPTWDIELIGGFEPVMTELAQWHEEQVKLRARVMGCSYLMASVVEEIMHCWLDCAPPVSPLARRVLLSFR